MPKKEIKIPRLIGIFLARLQHLLDLVFLWIFNFLKNKSSQPKKSDNRVVRTGKKVGKFIGDTGSEYYKEYEELKKK